MFVCLLMMLSKHFTVMRASGDILKKKQEPPFEVSGSFQDSMAFISLPDGEKLEISIKGHSHDHFNSAWNSKM